MVERRARGSGPRGASPFRYAIVSSRIVSCVQRAAAAALAEKSEIGMSPVTTRSWLPARDMSQLVARELHAVVRLGAVAHQIAEAPDLLDRLVLDVAEHRLEGGQVAVDVGQDGDAHQGAYSVGGNGAFAAAGCCSCVAVAAAAAATFLLRPRGVIEPVPVEAQQYFTASQLDRAEDFRSVQRLLGLGRTRHRNRHSGPARVAAAAAA